MSQGSSGSSGSSDSKRKRRDPLLIIGPHGTQIHPKPPPDRRTIETEKKDCDEWEKFFDENAEAYYWYNKHTGEARWVYPCHHQLGGKKKRKWSAKYKRSIDCKRPKGFSQKQHCKYGRKTRKHK